jgi:hypothetical protein
MATLTDTAYVSRLFIKVAGTVLVVLIVGRFSFDILWKYWKATHPPLPPSPEMAFGGLPAVDFPQKQEAELIYNLETPNGTLPTFGDRADVYLMPEQRPRFLALDQATKDAGSLGFTGKSEAQSEVVYRFKRAMPLPATLDINIYTGKFALSIDWPQDPNFFMIKNLPADSQAIAEVKSILKKASLIPDDLAKGDAQITYLKVNNGIYKESVSLSEADFVRVDLYRTKIEDKYEAVTPDPEQGIVRAIVSGNPDKGRLVQISYNYYPVNYQNKSAYPLKTPQQAWTELTQGSGYIAQLDSGINSVIVRRIELGYYDAYEPQPYFQPVYVFRGDDNFVAYVPAVSPPTTTVMPLPTTQVTGTGKATSPSRFGVLSQPSTAPQR